MQRVEMNNLGLPPLAGVCDYESACASGYDVEKNVALLKRYVYAESQLNQIFAAHLAHAPEWEVKCAASLHLWLDAEHSAMLRKRVSEMREPPLHLDKVPDVRLEAFFREAIRAESTLELLVSVYGVAKPELIRSYKKHLAETNPLVDHPTCRILRILLAEEEEMLAWGNQAIAALTLTEQDREAADAWRNHLQAYLAEAGGISGDLPKPNASETLPAPRAVPGERYEMKAEPRRDERFKDGYNMSAKIDSYFYDETLPADEKTYALLYKRLREMDVPEWMGPILYKTEGKPWEYYQDISRQLWDEARHAMMGEVGLYQDGVPFYNYPIDYVSSLGLNRQFTSLESHIVLWYIEQSLMPKDTGKRLEWVIAKNSDNELAWTFQDYDWADEVLHAQYGRKWLVAEFGAIEPLRAKGEELFRRFLDIKNTYADQSAQQEWWADFVRDMRDGREAFKSRAPATGKG